MTCVASRAFNPINQHGACKMRALVFILGTTATLLMGSMGAHAAAGMSVGW